MQEEKRADAHTYHRVFEKSRDGKLILADLLRLFNREVGFRSDVDGMFNSMLQAEGKGTRKVVQHIVNQINRANGVGEEDE